jgi:SWI/SNF-related matrix-associated actin-dependent regulator of chromatin subfamily A3
MECVRIEGSVSVEQRRVAIGRFKRDPNIRIMLLTLGTGAVGREQILDLILVLIHLLNHSSLNLTVASQVHIVEPNWNPTMEEQAATRVHRLGQTRQVTINRYTVKDSLEEVSFSQIRKPCR